MDVVDAIRSRKSIRGFKPDPVPKEVLWEILDIAREDKAKRDEWRERDFPANKLETERELLENLVNWRGFA